MLLVLMVMVMVMVPWTMMMMMVVVVEMMDAQVRHRPVLICASISRRSVPDLRSKTLSPSISAIGLLAAPDGNFPR